MAGERTLPGLGLTGFWNLGSAYKTGMDQNLLDLSTLSQLRAISRVTALPGSPTDGDIYIVPSGAGSNPNEIAVRDNSAWAYYTPAEGYSAYVEDEDVFVVWNGTAWVRQGNYDIGFFAADVMTDAEIIARFVAVRAFTVPVSATGSQAKAETASTGDVSFELQKNGVAFGTVRFNASATGAFTVASATSFAIGDVLKLVAPATADATLADVGISLKTQLL
jgi:hypothetical protein